MITDDSTNYGTSSTMTVKEAAAFLRVSSDAVYDAIKRGEIQAIRVGRLIRVARIPLMAKLTDTPPSF